ncbi:MAG: ABC transporter substrate-binding protein [Clostridia bacterium]|nr:ABC transporter substrate-binding protein [Clostridia bacterium]
MKRLLSIILCVIFLFSLVACTSKPANKPSKKESLEIYFLNFKPEIADIYKEIAAKYKEEKGVSVKVVTAASDTYETTLKSEIAKKDAPTIFQINGPVGYQSWKDYCLDLRGTELYNHLLDKDLAVKDGDGVYGIPYVVEGYGIIYNNQIMDKYFNLSDKKVKLASASEINDFKTLKAVVEDMSKHKKELGIDGVFASTSMSGGETWRWDSHLASVPFYYEMKDKNRDASTISTAYEATKVEFKYAENFKNLIDLYTSNSVSEKNILSGKSVDDSMAEFALGRAAMVQNGNWAWSQIKNVKGNTVDEQEIRFMPLYMGIDGEEKQGICIGTENYFSINSKVSEEKQKASIDFLQWLFTSETGKEYVTNKLEFITPFDTFDDNERPSDPLARQVIDWMGRDVETIDWTFNSFPNLEFKTEFGNSLLEYLQGTKSWDNVKDTVVRSWAEQRS